MLSNIFDTLSGLPAMLGSAAAGVVIEKLFNITGRFLIPLWKMTFGKLVHKRHLRIESAIMGDGETYAVGAAKHEIYVRQFALKGFKPQHLVSRSDITESAVDLLGRLPKNFTSFDRTGLKEEIAAKAHELDMAEEAWNAEKIALRSVRVSRSGSLEDPTLSLGFAETDYATFQVVAKRWEQFFKAGNGNSFALTSPDLRDVIPGLSNSFGVNLTIETADGQVILTQRSGKTQNAKNLRHISVNEGMSILDVDRNTGIPDPYLTAIRGIEEELGVNLAAEPNIRQKIVFHSLICDVTRYQWALLGHVDLSQTRWTNTEFLHARRMGLSPDDWESDSLTFLPLTASAIEAAIKDDSDWVGHGYLNLVLSALYRLRGQSNSILRTARQALLTTARTNTVDGTITSGWRQ